MSAAESEKVLRDRVRQFYQLQMDKKFRQAEAFVAEDTKDTYYNMSKGNLLGFEIAKVEFPVDQTKAKVTVRTRFDIMMMGVGKMPVEMPTTSLWKLEGGQWVLYIDPEVSAQSPFGKMAPKTGSEAGTKRGAIPPMPNLSDLQGKVRIDRTAVNLTAAEPSQVVKLTNDLPGPISVAIHREGIAGTSVTLDKERLASGETASIRFQRTGDTKPTGLVTLDASPIEVTFQIRVDGQ